MVAWWVHGPFVQVQVLTLHGTREQGETEDAGEVCKVQGIGRLGEGERGQGVKVEQRNRRGGKEAGGQGMEASGDFGPEEEEVDQVVGRRGRKREVPARRPAGPS